MSLIRHLDQKLNAGIVALDAQPIDLSGLFLTALLNVNLFKTEVTCRDVDGH